jgi:predicted dehydrogenase
VADELFGHAVVAIVDPDRDRSSAFNESLLAAGTHPIAWYPPDAFDRMVDETRPDAVIVASPDHSHVDYIVAALDRGLDVLTEKPMVATADQAARVLAAEARSSGSVRVTHNFRYTPRNIRIKQLVADGAIGRPLQVLLEYHVDRVHGASYFLRWNRQRSRSGGLSVHKSTHHLDLVSWWLDREPVSVHALGGRAYYGARSPHRPYAPDGTPVPNDRLRGVDPYFLAAQRDGAVLAGPNDRTGRFVLRAPHEYPGSGDDYLYDDLIDIEDHFAALVDYGGAHLAYLINFSSTWEGYRVTLTGTHGQIEAAHGALPGGESLGFPSAIRYRPLFGDVQTFDLETMDGGHDGADPLMRRDLFVARSELSLQLGLAAGAREGAVAVAAGEAIARSIETGRPVVVADLLCGAEGSN